MAGRESARSVLGRMSDGVRSESRARRRVSIARSVSPGGRRSVSPGGRMSLRRSNSPIASRPVSSALGRYVTSMSSSGPVTRHHVSVTSSRPVSARASSRPVSRRPASARGRCVTSRPGSATGRYYSGEPADRPRPQGVTPRGGWGVGPCQPQEATPREVGRCQDLPARSPLAGPGPCLPLVSLSKFRKKYLLYLDLKLLLV